jgi:hypothetical protein
MLNVCVPSGDTPFVAVSVTATVVLASLLVGVPVRIPEVGLNVIHAGSTLVALNVGAGVPVATAV